jgi:intracellular multiplication protein IcmK
MNGKAMILTGTRLRLRSSFCAAALFSSLLWGGVAFGQDAGGAGQGAGSDGTANGNSAAAQAQAVQNAIPLTPAMITQLAQRYQASQQAAEQAGTALAEPESREVNVSFAPGVAISIINTVKGYPSAVSFFDGTGQPWPVEWDTNSDPAAVATGNDCNVQQNGGGGGGPSVEAIGFLVCTPAKGSNVLEITPMSLAPRGGLVVSLQGAPKPLTFLLMSGTSTYDADLSVHVAGQGPNAQVAAVDPELDAPDTGAPFLTGMLEGVPPADATPLSVAGVSPEDLRAWKLGGNVYLRTSDTLLSPEWTASESEAGTTVYAVPDTPVVLLSVNGQTVSAELKEGGH